MVVPKQEDKLKATKEKDETKNDSNIEELTRSNTQLQNDVNSLKALMQQLIESQSQKEEVVVTSTTSNPEEDQDRDYSIIPPNKLVKVSSLFYGGMTLRGSNDKKIRFAR